ncbi:MAG: RHS repeat-associated core domain-containing protein, partial [Planctomycetales bacterium]|nr:RHS repeat-associated core domain-containing protein [Planctomycetales bacterium]
ESGADLLLEYDYDENSNMSAIRVGAYSFCGSQPRTIVSYTHDYRGMVLRKELRSCRGVFAQGIDYETDAFGRLLRINDPSLSAALDPGGDSNDVFGMQLGYDQAFPGQLAPPAPTPFVAAGSGVVPTTPRKNGNISWQVWNTAGQSSGAYVYGYDDRNRLTSANYLEKSGQLWYDDDSFDTSYQYDSVGNFLRVIRNDDYGMEQDVSYHYGAGDGRRLTSVSGDLSGTFAYDAAGNTKKHGLWTSNEMTYDYRNLMTSAEVDEDVLVTNDYDQSGARIRRTVSTWDIRAEEYYVDTVSHYTNYGAYENGRLLFWNVPGVGRFVPLGSPHSRAGLAFYITDHLANVRATVHETGVLLENVDYYPFGKEMPGRSTETTELPQFTGQLRDRDLPTPIDYFNARYYDGELGRFLSVDPRRDKFAALSSYSYAANNPVLYNDPDGRESKSAFIGAICDFVCQFQHGDWWDDYDASNSGGEYEVGGGAGGGDPWWRWGGNRRSLLNSLEKIYGAQIKHGVGGAYTLIWSNSFRTVSVERSENVCFGCSQVRLTYVLEGDQAVLDKVEYTNDYQPYEVEYDFDVGVGSEASMLFLSAGIENGTNGSVATLGESMGTGVIGITGNMTTAGDTSLGIEGGMPVGVYGGISMQTNGPYRNPSLKIGLRASDGVGIGSAGAYLYFSRTTRSADGMIVSWQRGN